MATKAYKHTGVCPIHLPENGGERIILPGTERFVAELTPELEAFLTQIEAIAVLPPVKAPAKASEKTQEKE